MKHVTKILSLTLFAAMAVSFTGCGESAKSSSSDKIQTVPASSSAASGSANTAGSLAFDNSKWNYDQTNKVYWQIKVAYCSKPQASSYETLGVYVPGTYMDATKNSDGTYTCKPSVSGKTAGYTASTAPIVFPVNTPGYASQAAPTSYSYNDVSSYMKAGFVYVCAGMRGRAGTMGGRSDSSSSSTSSNSSSVSGGAPWGITDLKAAIRYVRYNKSALPGNTDRIFTFGMSGGGAQSAIAGASGDSKLYIPYLNAIGAAMTDARGNSLSDAIDGAMCWCPITSLDIADEAYEWNMGQYFSTGTRANGTFTSILSKDLATEFAGYINKLGLKDKNGTALTLTKSGSGTYSAGSYYNYLLSEVETSLNNFLSDTKFPYTQQATTTMAGMPTGGTAAGNIPKGNIPGGAAVNGGGAMSGPSAGGGSQSGSNTGKTYQTAQAYIDSLNTGEKWITYNVGTNTAKITSMKAFVTHCKNASKSVGAFDSLDRSQAENSVFGNGSGVSYHFDSILANLLSVNAGTYAKYSGWKSSYVTDYAGDLKKTDSLGTAMASRMDMYNPMYYLSNYYSGYESAKVAPYWRIRTGINQGDTALTTETNLMLALNQYSGVKSVDFATVWGQPHTMAERTGDATGNFIAWVNQCVK